MATHETLVPAKRAAELLGLPRRSRNDTPSNHGAFLARLEARYPDKFPKARWDGSRKYYKISEVHAFIEALPTSKPERAQ